MNELITSGDLTYIYVNLQIPLGPVVQILAKDLSNH